MTEPIDSKIKKEWVTKALGSVNFSTEEKIDESVLNEEAVILLNGANMFGDAIYSYVKITLRNFRNLRDAMLAGENIIPSDYGQVVAAGRGEPTQEIKDEMRVQYKMVEVPKPVAAPAPKGFSQPKFFADDD